MRLDEHEFDMTAKAVWIMNDSARERYDTWEVLRSFLVGMAHSCSATMSFTTSFSTGGFQLTFFKGFDGETNVRSSVSSYTAIKYLEQLNKIMHGTDILEEK